MWEQLRCPRQWSYKWEVKKKEKKQQNRADIFLTLQPAEEPGSLKKKRKKKNTLLLKNPVVQGMIWSLEPKKCEWGKPYV